MTCRKIWSKENSGAYFTIDNFKTKNKYMIKGYLHDYRYQ